MNFHALWVNLREFILVPDLCTQSRWNTKPVDFINLIPIISKHSQSSLFINISSNWCITYAQQIKKHFKKRTKVINWEIYEKKCVEWNDKIYRSGMQLRIDIYSRAKLRSSLNLKQAVSPRRPRDSDFLRGLSFKARPRCLMTHL